MTCIANETYYIKTVVNVQNGMVQLASVSRCSAFVTSIRHMIALLYVSTYKFKRAFFRHDRRTAPKFGTHVWIETRLALTKKN